MSIATETKVIHVRDWDRSDPNAVYIGRAAPRSHLKASGFANPFVIGENQNTREDCVAFYELWVRGKLHDMTLGRAKWIREHLLDLDGKILVCWCKKSGQDVPCHGDPIIRMITEIKAWRRLA